MKRKILLKHFHSLTRPPNQRRLVFAMAFAILGGALLLVASHAASPSASLNADQGTLSSPAQIITDSKASNGHAVQFGTGGVNSLKLSNQGIFLAGKFVLHGGMNPIPSSPWDVAFGGMVVNATWADLQPSQNGPIVGNNQIDQALTAIRAYNSSHTHQLTLKVRLMTGIYAPDWAKTLNGFQPVTTASIQIPTMSGTIGPFWRSDYMVAYQDLESKLAAKYDSEALIRDVTVNACMTIFAEPFQRDDTNIAGYFAAGYQITLDQTCLKQQINAHSVWQHTRSSVAFNNYRAWVLQPDGTYAQAAEDVPFTSSVMDYCRSVLGNKCVLGNNSIRSSFIGNPNTSYGKMYAHIQQLGTPIYFQTGGPTQVGDLNATLQWGASMGANYIEVPSQYDTLITSTQLQADNNILINNPLPN